MTPTCKTILQNEFVKLRMEMYRARGFETVLLEMLENEFASKIYDWDIEHLLQKTQEEHTSMFKPIDTMLATVQTELDEVPA